jgi:hypothetical protein
MPAAMVKVVGRAFLADIGRGHVNYYLLLGHPVATVLQRRLDAEITFLHGVIGQAYYMVLGAGGNIYFYCDGDCLYPVNGAAKGFN